MSELSFSIQTFGCKVNTYDSGLLEKRLERFGFSLSRENPTVHILNTCAVTKEATREAVRTARRLKKKEPNALVVVTGCAAQVDTDSFGALPGVDLIVANSHKGSIENIIADHISGKSKERVFKSNIFKKDALEAGGGLKESRTRSFLKIQDGCNSFCTYCVIPFARGKSRSLSIEAICDRVFELQSSGVQEVVLTGIHIGDYEFGLAPLLKELLKKTAMPRFRLTSLEPQELTSEILELYQDERMCPHFHMSIQSASDKILKRMKRQYGAKDVQFILKEISKKIPNVFVGMDVIVGFPGEGEDEFLETYESLSELPWTRIHVFPYSERPGTYARRLDEKVSSHLISKRAARLRGLSLERSEQVARFALGSKKKVLFLNNSRQSRESKWARGISRDFWNVKIPWDCVPVDVDLEQKELSVKISGYETRAGGTQMSLIGSVE